MNDRDRIRAAVSQAQRVLSNFFERGEGCPIETINRVNALMSDSEAVGAFRRLSEKNFRDASDAPLGLAAKADGSTTNF